MSPRLIPAVEIWYIKLVSEEWVGPYELHELLLYYTLRCGFRPKNVFALALRAFGGTGNGSHFDEEVIRHWLTVFYRRFFSQQFKRSCLPDGPKVGTCSLSPRGDWRMPSDASAAAWLDDLKEE